MTGKPTNPKDACGIRKASLAWVPPNVLMELGTAMMEGALKYAPYNWRKAGVRSSVYYDALQRHIMAWWEGEDIDPDSGISHLTKAMACLAVVRDAQKNDMLTDDRPTPCTGDWQRDLNSQAAGLIDRYFPKEEEDGSEEEDQEDQEAEAGPARGQADSRDTVRRTRFVLNECRHCGGRDFTCPASGWWSCDGCGITARNCGDLIRGSRLDKVRPRVSLSDRNPD